MPDLAAVAVTTLMGVFAWCAFRMAQAKAEQSRRFREEQREREDERIRERLDHEGRLEHAAQEARRNANDLQAELYRIREDMNETRTACHRQLLRLRAELEEARNALCAGRGPETLPVREGRLPLAVVVSEVEIQMALAQAYAVARNRQKVMDVDLVMDMARLVAELLLHARPYEPPPPAKGKAKVIEAGERSLEL